MTRDRKLVALFSVLAVMAGTFVGVHVATAGPAVHAVSRTVTLQDPASLTVQFLGDTMLGDAAQPDLDRNGYQWPLQYVAPLLSADFSIANAEAPISARTGFADPLKDYSYASSPAAARALAASGIDALGLANNHANDLGPLGLADTVANARRQGMATFGAGRLPLAERPLLIRSPAGTLGIVGIGENFGSRTTAGTTQAGTVVLSPRAVQRGVDLARAAGAEWVVAYVHWGDNYQPVVPQQRAWARVFADAGYDMVIGTGPHVVQPIKVVRGMPVVYSIGNFVFGSPGRFASFGMKGYGLSMQLELARHQPIGVSATCLRTDNDDVNYQPRPCTPQQAAELFSTVSPRLSIVGNKAFLRCACLGPRG